MSTIQELMTIEIPKLIKAKDKDTLPYIRLILGEFTNVSETSDKKISDEKAISVLRKLRASAIETRDAYISKGREIPQSEIVYLSVLDSYIPSLASEENVRAFIKTIDFSSLPNKMKAIGLVKTHFNGNVDGNIVKNIITTEF